jgi:nucleotide-binding universal stress UspA family protein
MADIASTHPDKVRTFLCVVDESSELSRALRFACKRAKTVGGRVALVYVIQPIEFQHWIGVGDLMQQEAREHAEALLSDAADKVQLCTGEMPIIFIREGNTTEELLTLLDEEKGISLLVLGAATGKEGPGPLVSYFIEKAAGRMRVPITVVPGNLSDEDIDAIT